MLGQQHQNPLANYAAHAVHGKRMQKSLLISRLTTNDNCIVNSEHRITLIIIEDNFNTERYNDKNRRRNS